MLNIKQICRFLQKIIRMVKQLVAKTLSGLEDILASELKKLAFENVKVLKRAVSFQGDLREIYKANYCCRTVLRVLKPIAEFAVQNEDELYDNIKKIEWEKYLDLRTSFAIDGFVANSKITHSYYSAPEIKRCYCGLFC